MAKILCSLLLHDAMEYFAKKIETFFAYNDKIQLSTFTVSTLLYCQLYSAQQSIITFYISYMNATSGSLHHGLHCYY